MSTDDPHFMLADKTFYSVCGFVIVLFDVFFVENSEHHRHPSERHGPKHDRLPAQELPEIRQNTVMAHTHFTACAE